MINHYINHIKTAHASREVASAFHESASAKFKVARAYKSGGVSLYIVVFLTLIFGIITLGFTRIVLNDAAETSNTDLYNSAYDSALAGIEDAKIALIKYHDCLSQGAVANAAAENNTCPRIVYEMEHGIAQQSCDVVQATLGRDRESQQEVVVQETQSTTDAGSAVDMEQAYTCVKITEETDDYLTTLSASDTTRIIPLRSADINAANYIQFSWYSTANGTDYKFMPSGVLEQNAATPYAPPVISLEFFQTDTNGDSKCVATEAGAPCFSVGELSVNNSDSSGSDRALLLLHPVSGNGHTVISADTVLNNSDKYDNAPIDVECNSNGTFACTATIELPPAFRKQIPASATSFLRVTSPYGRPSTDISASLCSTINNGTCSDNLKLTGVQAAIDSTGRANDLYRRVEVRVELVDLYYPYPEYALFLGGTDDLNKNFWVTRKCRTADDGHPSDCRNSGSL